VFKNGTVNVKVIEKRNNVKMMQTSTKSASDASGQSYVVNSPKNQVKIFKKSGAQIGIYRAEGMKTPMAVETIGLYFWIADTGNNRILLLKAPRQLEP
jgi:DNA-binding beta-propeller fold protein YncE